MISIFDHTGECSSSCNDANLNSRTSSSCVSEFYMSEDLHDIKPDVPNEFKPTKETRFKDVDEGVNFYKRYAEKDGFDVRLNTLRKVGDVIKHRFLVCNRMGVYCKMGATKAYKLKSTLKGGFQCDENNVLNAMFWADETDKADYNEFEDVMSFDATFRTNKYSLVLVPFTVIDHHKSSVTVGVGLLSMEDVDSYKWLLEQVMKVHSNKQLLLVLTDQDATLKQAV
uniref:MULE transposase domain-containing protein n=1 Tax=Lactuca sativa TaxID=4236 RepID=A0A9R1VDZ9_LACSA|nr:hypothetical protein LSAT_V11C500275160 [Lactuca sativa]